MCTTLTCYSGSAVGTTSTKPNVPTWTLDVVDRPTFGCQQNTFTWSRLSFWKHLVVFLEQITWTTYLLEAGICSNNQLDVVCTVLRTSRRCHSSGKASWAVSFDRKTTEICQFPVQPFREIPFMSLFCFNPRGHRQNTFPCLF